MICIFFFWWVLQHCTGFARLVWGRLRVHRAFVYEICIILIWYASFLCDMHNLNVIGILFMWLASSICDLQHFDVIYIIRIWYASLLRDMHHCNVVGIIFMWCAFLSVWHDSCFKCDVITESSQVIHMWHRVTSLKFRHTTEWVRDVHRLCVTWLISEPWCHHQVKPFICDTI